MSSSVFFAVALNPFRKRLCSLGRIGGALCVGPMHVLRVGYSSVLGCFYVIYALVIDGFLVVPIRLSQKNNQETPIELYVEISL